MKYNRGDTFVCVHEFSTGKHIISIGDIVEFMEYNPNSNTVLIAHLTGYHNISALMFMNNCSQYIHAKAQLGPSNLQQSFVKPPQQESVQKQKENPYDKPTAIDLDYEDYDYYGTQNQLIKN